MGLWEQQGGHLGARSHIFNELGTVFGPKFESLFGPRWHKIVFCFRACFQVTEYRCCDLAFVYVLRCENFNLCDPETRQDARQEIHESGIRYVEMLRDLYILGQKDSGFDIFQLDDFANRIISIQK